jgi:glycosyltransferase involved in cell wall biosynthesis
VNHIPPRLPRECEATLRVAFVTVGDTKRLTGGYLYNARVIAGLRQQGIGVEEIVASGASRTEQEASRFDLNAGSFAVVVVDALARVVCAPHLDRWRETLPVVAMVHELPSVATGDAREQTFEEPLLRADFLVTVSDHGASVLTGRGVPAGRVRVVPPGLDRLPAPKTAAKPSVRDGAPLRVLCVAQWIPRKGVLDLVQAWTARERPNADLELIGETDADPGYAASVRAAVAGSPGSSVVVRGPVDDATLAGAYAATDLFALPSRYEGYGVVYAEALAHGLPVLACDVGPVPELVGGEAALLVPPGDVGALSEALGLLLGDAARRRRMSGAAKRRAACLPRWEDAVAGFRHVLREAFETRWDETSSL